MIAQLLVTKDENKNKATNEEIMAEFNKTPEIKMLFDIPYEKTKYGYIYSYNVRSVYISKSINIEEHINNNKYDVLKEKTYGGDFYIVLDENMTHTHIIILMNFSNKGHKIISMGEKKYIFQKQTIIIYIVP